MEHYRLYYSMAANIPCRGFPPKGIIPKCLRRGQDERDIRFYHFEAGRPLKDVSSI